MAEEQQYPTGSISQLQEAIDTIVKAFDHPDDISVEYTFQNGVKRTIIEIPTGADRNAYELVYDGQDENAEPELEPTDA